MQTVGPNALKDDASSVIAPFNRTIRVLMGDISDDRVINTSVITLVNSVHSQAYNNLAEVKVVCGKVGSTLP